MRHLLEKYCFYEAFKNAEQIILDKPNQPLGYIIKAKVLMQIQKVDAAIECLNLSANQFPENKELYSLLGDAYLINKNFSELLKLEDFLLFKWGDHPLGYQLSIKILMQLCEYDLVVKNCKEYIQKFPNNIGFYNQLGNCYCQHLNDMNSTLKVSALMIEQFPSNVAGYILKSNLYIKQEKYIECINFLQNLPEPIQVLPAIIIKKIACYNCLNLVQKSKELILNLIDNFYPHKILPPEFFSLVVSFFKNSQGTSAYYEFIDTIQVSQYTPQYILCEIIDNYLLRNMFDHASRIFKFVSLSGNINDALKSRKKYFDLLEKERLDRALICVGFAKSGTSLLDYIFGSNTFGTNIDSFYVRPFFAKEAGVFLQKYNNVKEFVSNYFTPKHISHYRSNKFKKGESYPIFFESVPGYIATNSNIKKAINNIKHIIVEPKIIVCLRHPVYRAFSHYLHIISTLSNHINININYLSKLKSFEKMLMTDHSVNQVYFEKIKYLIENIGKDNIIFFFTEVDTKNLKRFYLRLTQLFDFPLDKQLLENDIPKINGQRKMPSFFYNEFNDIAISTSDSKQKFILPKGDLFVSSYNDDLVYPCYNPILAKKFLEKSKDLTSILSIEKAQEYYSKFFQNDFEKTLDLITSTYPNHYNLEFYKNFEYKEIQTSKASPAYYSLKKQLQEIC